MELRFFEPDDPEQERFLAQRRAPRHADESLTGTTRSWLRRLPAGRRPLRLCVTYPRVANRIAWSWADVETTRDVLADLLEDRRGGRRGFPRPVVTELRRLRDFNDRGRHDTTSRGLLDVLARALGAG